MRTKHTFRLPPDLAGKLADYAARKRVPQALVVEAALASHLSPDGADRLEAALARRLDRMTRQIERLERHVTISNEALALFVRFWLTSTPAVAGYRPSGGADQGPRALRRLRRSRSVGDLRAGGRSPMKSCRDVARQSNPKASRRAHRPDRPISADACLSTPRPYAPSALLRFPISGSF